mmetsp:Transcript_37653/g.93216  ORF Transcript_37653/g.93216 Transcript_37653/m.93216 type:complete len:399 (+) Transcript_37653:922-2118(+)
MQQNEFDITAVIGGRVRQFPGEATAVGGSDPLFVIEADEYDGAFLGLNPSLAIVTGIEFDHPDKFESIRVVQTSFARFMRRVCKGGCIVACGDIANLQLLQMSCANKDLVTYGFGEHNSWRAVDISTNSGGGSDFSVVHSGEKICEVSLPIPGHHNVLNALAAFVAALVVCLAHNRCWVMPAERKLLNASSAIDPSAARLFSNIVTALGSYRGVVRRMQYVGTVGTCAIYDDYAHHPSAIRAVIKAIRQSFPGTRLVVVFQPHTYSRTVALLHEFAEALSLADRVIVTAVYEARKEADSELSSQVTGQDLARLIKGKSLYTESLQDTARQFVIEVRPYHAHASQLCSIPGESGIVTEANRINLATPEEVQKDVNTVIACLGAGDINELSAILFGLMLA